MLPHYGLIHMNGRVFDPKLARFASADPFIDDARDAQSYNRYSYVNNNPLTYSDPSGYFKLKDLIKIVAVVAIGVVTGLAAVSYAITGSAAHVAGAAAFMASGIAGPGAFALAGAAGGFAAGFAGSLLNGSSLGDAFKSGLVGAATGAISGGIGNRIGTALGGKGLPKWAAHGALQGSLNEATGGSFRHGFTAGFFSSAAGGPIMKAGNEWGTPGRTAAAAIVGGTASRLGGGKFANGAVSGAFTHLFNDEAHIKAAAARSSQPSGLSEGEIVGSGEVTVVVRQPKPKRGRELVAWKKRNNGYVGEATVTYNIRRGEVDGVEYTWVSDMTVVSTNVVESGPFGGPFSGYIGFKGVGAGFSARIIVTTGTFLPVGNASDGFRIYGKVTAEARIFAGVSIQPNFGGMEASTYNPVVWDTGLTIGKIQTEEIRF